VRGRKPEPGAQGLLAVGFADVLVQLWRTLCASCQNVLTWLSHEILCADA
jgi:hypothetical protein